MRTFTLSKHFIDFEDSLYEVVRTINDKPNFPVTEFKEWLGCDKVLRRENVLFFCKKVDEAVIVEETKNEENGKENESRLGQRGDSDQHG